MDRIMATLLLLFVSVSGMWADTIYSVQLPSLVGHYLVQTSPIQRSAPVALPVVSFQPESTAFYFHGEIDRFPILFDSAHHKITDGIDYGGDLLFPSATFPSNSLGETWGVPLEPNGTSFDINDGHGVRLVLTLLPDDQFDFWMIQDWPVSYQNDPQFGLPSPAILGAGIAYMIFGPQFLTPGMVLGRPGKVSVTSAFALASPDTLITPMSLPSTVPEPSTLFLLIAGLIGSGFLFHDSHP